jgi:hypothetical protein
MDRPSFGFERKWPIRPVAKDVLLKFGFQHLLIVREQTA